MGRSPVSAKAWCAALDKLPSTGLALESKKRPVSIIKKPKRPKMTLTKKRNVYDAVRRGTPWLGMDTRLANRGGAYLEKLLHTLASYDDFNDSNPRDDHSRGIMTVGRMRVAFEIGVMEIFEYVPTDRVAGHHDVGFVSLTIIDSKK